MTSVSQPGGAWRIADVFLLTDGTDGRVAIPHLQLSFDTAGAELAKVDGQLAWQCAWGDLAQLWTGERSAHPDGGEGIVVVMVEKGGRRHRFVLPTEEPEAAESKITELARAHGLPTRDAPPVSRTLTVAVVLAAAATLTVLLLSATHVIHF
jgi:hypothetical protein